MLISYLQDVLKCEKSMMVLILKKYHHFFQLVLFRFVSFGFKVKATIAVIV